MLTKRPDFVFIPGHPGHPGWPATPPIPAEPERVVCEPTPPARGHYETRCDTVCLPVGKDDQGNWQYVCGIPRCRSVWVQTSPPGPVMCRTIPSQPEVPGQPAMPPTPPIPARVEQRAVFAWDAGANSTDEHEGDCRLEFTLAPVVGAVIGLTDTRDAPGTRDRVTHGFYVFGQDARRCVIVESTTSGVTSIGPEFAWDDETMFEIRRVGGTVTYSVDGVPMYTSRNLSEGTAYVGCSIFATGDQVP